MPEEITAPAPQGSTNKLASDVRQAIIEAFSILGGAQYLTKIAIARPMKHECNGLLEEPENWEPAPSWSPQPGPQTNAIKARW